MKVPVFVVVVIVVAVVFSALIISLETIP